MWQNEDRFTSSLSCPQATMQGTHPESDVVIVPSALWRITLHPRATSVKDARGLQWLRIPGLRPVTLLMALHPFLFWTCRA